MRHPPLFLGSLRVLSVQLQVFCCQAQILQSGREHRKGSETSFSSPLRSCLTEKALTFTYLEVSPGVLFLELYLLLNAVCFSGLFRPFRISRGHLCWDNKHLSSKFLFSAYQAGVHFNFLDAGHELLNLSCLGQKNFLRRVMHTSGFTFSILAKIKDNIHILHSPQLCYLQVAKSFFMETLIKLNLRPLTGFLSLSFSQY